MGNAVEKRDDSMTDATSSDPFMAMVERLAQSPNINADTVDRLLAAQERVRDRAARDEFYDSMNRVQSRLPSVMPNKRNNQTHSDYADLQAISSAIKPVYTAEGFSASFWQAKAETEGYVRVEGLLRHSGGHSEPYSVELPPDAKGLKGNDNKTAVHATGSTFTYARRYLVCLMFDVAVGDDLDGNQPVELVSDDQLASLEALIAEVQADRAGFLKFCTVDRLADLPAAKFERARKALESKRKDKANAGS